MNQRLIFILHHLQTLGISLAEIAKVLAEASEDPPPWWPRDLSWTEFQMLITQAGIPISASGLRQFIKRSRRSV